MATAPQVLADVAGHVAARPRQVAAARQPRAAGGGLRASRLPPSRVLRRSCACDGKQSKDKCDDCTESQAKPGSEAPPIVAQALGSPGSPLQPSLRTDMESWLGADFGAVRVHADATSAASAEAVGAHAYALGSDIVFGRGLFDPGSEAGRQLLAHELVHVTQQPHADPSGPIEIGPPESGPEREADRLSASVTAAGPAGRQAAEPAAGTANTLRRVPQATTTFAAPPNVCSPAQTRTLMPAVATAQLWLRTADQGLAQFIASPAAPAAARAAAALRRHFPPGDAATAAYVQERIRQIAQRLRTDQTAPSSLVVECHTEAADLNCGSAGAYVQSDTQLMVFCPSFFTGSPTWQARTAVHEISHSLTTGPHMHITDRAYQSDRKDRNLSPGEALTNAESYEMFVAEFGLNTAVESTAPTDPVHDCPADWTPLLTAAAADAQRWNRDALTAILDRRPLFLAQYASLCDNFLGGHTPALLDAAARDYRQMSSGFEDAITFECEPGGGGRCDTSETYWYAIGAFHICPRWRARATADDRAEGILTGMYGYRGNIDNNGRRRSLAGLARAIHYQFWAPPTQADVAAALVPQVPGTPPAP